MMWPAIESRGERMVTDTTFNSTIDWNDRTANWNIADGMTVYSTDGEKLGTVRNYNKQAGYLDVHKGWLFTKDFYVPFALIDTVGEDGITLSITKEALNSDDRYLIVPVQDQAAPEPVILADGSVLGASDRTDLGGTAVPAPERDTTLADKEAEFKNRDKGVGWVMPDMVASDAPEVPDVAREDQRFRAR
jgi:hypothetical protein